MWLGLAEGSELRDEVLVAVREPFAGEDARTALEETPAEIGELLAEFFAR